MEAMLAGLFVIITQITMSTCPTSLEFCGCLIGTDEVSGSLIADCSNNPELDLDFNCLASQRPEFLDLSGNELQEVPVELNLSGFKNLKHLDLSRNNITSLVSYNFGAWTRLQSLNISHNCLTDLPKGKSLIRTIDVSYNQLTNMHSIFGLASTTAIVRGNHILCKCNSSLVQRLYNLTIFSGSTIIECSLHDRDLPKPIPVQCMYDINKTANPPFPMYYLVVSLGIIITYCIYVFV